MEIDDQKYTVIKVMPAAKIPDLTVKDHSKYYKVGDLAFAPINSHIDASRLMRQGEVKCSSDMDHDDYMKHMTMEQDCQVDSMIQHVHATAPLPRVPSVRYPKHDNIKKTNAKTPVEIIKEEMERRRKAKMQVQSEDGRYEAADDEKSDIDETLDDDGMDIELIKSVPDYKSQDTDDSSGGYSPYGSDNEEFSDTDVFEDFIEEDQDFMDGMFARFSAQEA